MTLLTITTLVTAQESYVIDSVCVDGERIYRRDGEKSYTYDWSVTDTLDNPVDNPTGVPFVEIEGTDTTWGSEITYQWLDVGEFDIVVFVYSEHGCDTIEQGRVKVFEPPVADAGPDVIVCSFSDIEISADTAWNYSAVSWASLGDGTFSNPNLLHPTYYLGPNDNLNGNITLVLTAFGLADNITCNPDNDSVTYFFSKPDIAFSVVELMCYNDMNAKIEANVIDGRRPYKYEWTGPNGFVATGDSIISDLGAGKYVLTVTDANLCTDIDSVEIVNPPELLLSIDSIQHLTCYGYSDGFIIASAVGGTGKYKFILTGPSDFFAINDSVYNLYA
ncbi:MAG: hypothetical protein KAH25_12995, partial [Bacteroidales bacterium]|nr:hypothetical protein [Bacteroidales bacterium]